MSSSFRNKVFTRIAARLSAFLQQKIQEQQNPLKPTQISLTPVDARIIYEIIVAEIFEATCKSGAWSLPKGFGSLVVRTLQRIERTVPKSREVISVGEREKVRYKMGTAVGERLRTGKSLVGN